MLKFLNQIRRTARGHTVGRPSCRRDVIAHWLRIEMSKPKPEYNEIRHQVPRWLALPQPELEQKIRSVKDLWDNPVSFWTMDAKDAQRVQQWVLRQNVPVEEFWTDGWPSIRTYVDRPDVQGNFTKLFPCVQGVGEFQSVGPVSDEQRTLIGVLESRDDHQGSIHLVDGAHRLIAMLREGVKTVDVFVGRQTAESLAERGTRDDR